MEPQERFLPSMDDHKIPLLCWQRKTPIAVLVIAHGMAEHAARYHGLAAWLNEHNVAVYALQHRGHGPHCSPGDHGHYHDDDGWPAVINDLDQVVQLARSEHPGCPISLFGHSMGSFIAQAYAQRHGDQIDGLLLCATNRIDRFKLSACLWLVRLISAVRGRRHRSKLIDALSFGTFNKSFAPNRTSHDWLSRDESQVDQYLADPLCGFLCTVGLWQDFIKGMLSLNPDNFPRTLPVHLMAGDEDPVGEMGKGFRRHVAALRNAGANVASERHFEGARHELINETVAEDVWAHILNCISAEKT